MIRPQRYVVLLLAPHLLAPLFLAGCSGGSTPATREPATSSPVTSSTDTSSTGTSSTGTPDSATPSPSTSPRTASPSTGSIVEGIDASHHQGEINWERVAAAGIDFAYLKATEGQGFKDPRFEQNAREAKAAGIRVGAYHYYSLCGQSGAQAANFIETVEEVLTDLPPVVDLELIGNCDPPPPGRTLRAEVSSFLELVEGNVGAEAVIYFHPDFDTRYPELVESLDRELWVRRVGATPPPGDWHIWQRNDKGRLDGIEGPVDLNVMRVR